MVRTRTVESHPKLRTLACAGRTDVSVRVVTIDAPGCEYPFRKSILAGSADVIHDFASAIFNNRFANSPGEIVKHRIPTDPFPLSFAAFSGALQWIENPIRIGDLIERGRTFGAI